MFLTAYFVRLANPVAELVIQLRWGYQSKRVQVTAWGERFDALEGRGLVALGQNQVASQCAALRHERGKAHAYLEGDSALLRDHRDRAACLDFRHEQVIERPNLRIASREERIEIERAARMPAVGGRELLAAFRAPPEWRLRAAHRSHDGFA